MAVWAALKQMSENKNDGNMRCFGATYENKNAQHGAFLLPTLLRYLAELSNVFQAGCMHQYSISSLMPLLNPSLKLIAKILIMN